MGFYDAKGYWRNDGEGFYDAKGNWINPGEGFYDYKGYFRSPGDGFYDAKGNWVNPGGPFYDSKGYRRTVNVSTATKETSDENIGILLFLVSIPIAIFGCIMSVWVEWIISHLYVTFWGYAVINAVFCFMATKRKKHQGIKYILSYIGNYMSTLTFVYIALVYAVPYVIINGQNFGSFFECILVLAFGIAGIVVIQFLNYYHEIAILEFILGIIFFVMVILLLKDNVQERYTIDSLAEIYNIKDSIAFKIMFGFVV